MRNMAIFYLDVRQNGKFFPDGEGIDLPDIDAAEREAVETAAFIGRDSFLAGNTRAIVVEVRNEHGQNVLNATVALTIARLP